MEVLQVDSELELMMDLYREKQPQRVLEIGVWDGGTLKQWLTQGQPEVVVAVDLDHRNRDAYDGWRHPDTSLYCISGPSQDAWQIAEMVFHAPYDWVFIDGDHGQWIVQSDVETCVPLIRKGGLLLLHDVEAGAGFGGDTYAPRTELRKLAAAGYKTWEWVDPAPSAAAHGIGVVQL